MLSDCEILRRVQNGERELFGELHVRHHERVFRFVAHSIWQREAAEDIAADVWLRAYGAVDKFDPKSESSVLSWLLTIASNRMTDYRRRLKPQVSLDDEAASTLQMASPAAERQAMRFEKGREVRKALSQLKESDRQIIYLAHMNEFSSSQIAQILEKNSVSAVTSHLHRAMRHLKIILEKNDWFGEKDIEVRSENAEMKRRKSA